MEIIKFILSNFWPFIGSVILISIIPYFIYKFYSRDLRHRILMKYGYPPEHCDADGNFKEKEDNTYHEN